MRNEKLCIKIYLINDDNFTFVCHRISDLTFNDVIKIGIWEDCKNHIIKKYFKIWKPYENILNRKYYDQ